MNLTLVISNPAQLLHGHVPTHRFDRKGGSIGSSTGDWRLRDRSHRVHPQHCQVLWHEGHFCVIDQCGHTYVNGHDLPLGRGTTVRLSEGDFLQIGAYRVIAHLHPHGSPNDDRLDDRQRSVNELLNDTRDGWEHWDEEALPLLPDIAAVARTCPEFEQLSRPLDNAPEQDPLRAFITPAPARDVLDLPAPAQPATKPVVDGPHPSRQKAHGIAGNLRLGLLLLTCLSFSGCTLLDKVGQVILDPSIPVGGPNEQPSRYSLSLHASDDVNLRLISPGTAPHSPEDAHLSRYTLNVQANSPLALTNKLQTLLDHLYESVPAQSLISGMPEPHVQMSPMTDTLLGDYDAQGVSLSTPLDHRAPQQIATPIAFKVLQLSDDSLLINATLQALHHDLEKTLGSTYVRADDYLLQPGQFKFVDLRPLEERSRFIAVIANYHSADVAQWKQLLRVEPKGRQYAVLVQLGNSQVDLKWETR